LIRAFGPTPVAEVEKSPAYAQVRGRYPEDENFKRLKDAVGQAKTSLELTLEGQGGVEQVKAAIWELLTRRRSPERDLFHGLIVSGYRDRPGNWTEAQKQHFDKAWKLIQLEYDFFLSFTTRFAKVAGDNPVNTRYEHFIRKEISDAEYEGADRRKTNLLAVTIHRLLSDPQHLGFFFPHTQGANKAVKATLEKAVRGSIVFVQVIQNVLFAKPTGPEGSQEEAENYCFWEYTRALETYGDTAEGRLQMVFVGAEDAYSSLVKPFHVPPLYQPWYKHVGHNGVPYLEGTPKFDPDKIEALRQVVLTKLKPLLDDVWDRLLTTVPP
jgi:hypothetical protein